MFVTAAVEPMIGLYIYLCMLTLLTVLLLLFAFRNDARDAQEVAVEARAAVAVQRTHAEAALQLTRERRDTIARVREACRTRGIAVGPPMFQDMRRTLAAPYVGSDDNSDNNGSDCNSSGPHRVGELHWPLLILYPEYNTSDYLEDVGESAAIEDIVAAVLPSGNASSTSSRPAWDARAEYVADNVDVFFRERPIASVPIERAWDWVDETTGSTAASSAASSSDKKTGTTTTSSSGSSVTADDAAAPGGTTSSAAASNDASIASIKTSLAAADSGSTPIEKLSATTDSCSSSSSSSSGTTSSNSDSSGSGRVTGSQRWIRVPPEAPLLAVTVAPGFVVTDIPVLYVVAKSSAFHAEMKRRGGGRFHVLAPPK